MVLNPTSASPNPNPPPAPRARDRRRHWRVRNGRHVGRWGRGTRPGSTSAQRCCRREHAIHADVSQAMAMVVVDYPQDAHTRHLYTPARGSRTPPSPSSGLIWLSAEVPCSCDGVTGPSVASELGVAYRCSTPAIIVLQFAARTRGPTASCPLSKLARWRERKGAPTKPRAPFRSQKCEVRCWGGAGGGVGVVCVSSTHHRDVRRACVPVVVR